MRKILLVLFGITAMFGFNKVHAADIKLKYDTNINEVESVITEIGIDKVKDKINEVISLYNTEYSIEYPYYFISLVKPDINNSFIINLIAFSEIGNHFYQSFGNYGYESYYQVPVGNSNIQIKYDYNFSDDIFSSTESVGLHQNFPLIYVSADKQQFNPYTYYYSNFDLYYRGSSFKQEIDNLNFFKSDDTFFIPTFEDSSLYSVHKADSDFLIEPYYLYDNNLDLKEETFTTIDLNQYSYVALSLKDYSKTVTFFTNVYVKGNYCITPVYNYGMTEKSEYYPGYQVDRCSPYYEDFTAVRTYILEQDLKNNAIYYLKAYDKTKDNVVKVDSSVFNITYITEEQKDNPYVSIGGKNYPTISYDNLNSSSTKSEEEGYISGVVCQVGDFNCYSEHNPSNIFDEIFSSPLKFLEDIWESVTSIFKLIAEFISLLPPIMQSFLYLSFMVAVILGLLKIIL